MNKINILFVVFISLSLFGCASNKGSTSKIKNELDVVSIKRDGLTTTTKTFKEGPSIGYKKSLKPRREISSSAKKINKPDFPISINFTNTDLGEALIGLGQLAKKIVVVDYNINGLLNYSAKDQPWNNVFNSIIDINNLTYSVDNELNIIKITGGNSSEDTQVTEIFNIYYEKPSVLKTQLETIMSGGDAAESASAITIVENDENKTLMVKASQSQLNEIEKILSKIDIKKPQVLIEAFLVEVSPTFASKLGTRLGLTKTKTSGNGGQTNILRGGVGTAGSDVALGNDVASATNFLVSGTSGLGIIRSTSSGELKFEIDALETEGDSRTLSNPKLFTVSGKNAIIKQGTQVGINETTTTDGTIQTSVKYYEANLLLDVTPVITGDGSVMMEVKINNDSFDLSVTPPKITKKEINTNLILVDGDIAVVGGILTETLSENNKRVPGLGKLPGAGALFRSKEKVDDRQELLIFLAPRII